MSPSGRELIRHMCGYHSTRGQVSTGIREQKCTRAEQGTHLPDRQKLPSKVETKSCHCRRERQEETISLSFQDQAYEKVEISDLHIFFQFEVYTMTFVLNC